MFGRMSFHPTYPHQLLELPPAIDTKDPVFLELLIQSRTELGELKGYSFSLPNPLLLLSPAILKESVASSNIENINTTLVDVLQNQLFPETERRAPDKEVLRYRDAVLWGFAHLKEYSLSTRLILGIQQKLIPSSHGQYRKQQNRIANSTNQEALYTPPLPSDLPRLISNWENFVHRNEEMDPLIRCAIAHYQFEAIHPFDDGNGRTGRILMVLQLINDGVLEWPILYISGYINENRSDYYRALLEVTKTGKWNEFVCFMLKGFHRQARETKNTLLKIMSLFFETKEKLKKEHKKIYSADLVEALFSYPIITPVRLAEVLGAHYTTTSRYLLQLAQSGFLKETKHGKYHLFINDPLIKIMKR